MNKACKWWWLGGLLLLVILTVFFFLGSGEVTLKFTGYQWLAPPWKTQYIVSYKGGSIAQSAFPAKPAWFGEFCLSNNSSDTITFRRNGVAYWNSIPLGSHANPSAISRFDGLAGGERGRLKPGESANFLVSFIPGSPTQYIAVDMAPDHPGFRQWIGRLRTKYRLWRAERTNGIKFPYQPMNEMLNQGVWCAQPLPSPPATNAVTGEKLP